MKKLGALFVALSLVAGVMAQNEANGKQSLFSKMSQKNILNHMDVGVNVGTVGLGIDVAMPVGDYVRVRAGYNYLPSFKAKSDFTVESSNGSIQRFIDKWNSIDIYAELEKRDIDINNYPQYKDLLDKFGNVKLYDQVTMGISPNAHQFKFLVDILPFKNNKHWSFTAGFFAGTSNVGEAHNLEKEKQILEGVLAYNDLYIGFCKEEYPHIDVLEGLLFKTGVAGFRLGTFDNGDMAIMVPSEDATAHAELKVNKVRPYLGFGYNTDLSRDKKWKLNVDVGLLILGKPHVYVDNIYRIDKSVIDQENFIFDVVRWNDEKGDYDGPEELGIIMNDVDLDRDLHDIPGKVGNMTNTISKFKVYPNASVTFSYRLF